MQKTVCKIVEYKSFEKCIKLDNGIVDLIITVSEGPRIIRYGFSGKQNELCDDAPMTLPVFNEEWRLMGGHRLLHCPEEYPRTYEPDNDPVRWEEIPDGVKVIYEINKISNIQKEMEITLSSDGAKVKILHRLINNNAWPIKTAPWACTVMAAGGKVLLPFGQQASHFKDGAANARNVAFWSYTDVSDKRINWGEKYVAIGFDAELKTNLKMGFSNKAGWGAYLNKGHLFLIKTSYIENKEYPDNGCSYEVFSCDFMTEIETLAPYTMLSTGEEATHTEQWDLIKDVDLESWSNTEIDEMVSEHIEKE